jgi:bacterioferritin
MATGEGRLAGEAKRPFFAVRPTTDLSILQRLRRVEKYMSEDFKISRERMVELLNEDLSREYQAIIAYTIYSQTIKGAAYNNIAAELEGHAAEELSHALLLARQIDYLNGTPTSTPQEVKISSKAEDMLRFDLENERQTIVNYRQRIRQADAIGEFALGEILRKIIEQEQDHLLDLADALGIDAPNVAD